MNPTNLESVTGTAVNKQRYSSDQLTTIQGEKVVVAFDPLFPGAATVYRPDGSFLCVSSVVSF